MTQPGAPLFGLIQDRPLLISSMLTYVATYHPRRELVSALRGGTIHRYDYAAAARRVAQLAHALVDLGIRPGDRVGTLAWNGYRHFELFFAVSGIGAVLHTVNPRLFDEQIAYIVNHGEDRLLFVDASFLPLVERLRPHLPTVERVFALSTDEASAIGEDYEALLAGQPEQFDWPVFDERTASALCYTSGTTGDPKGVLYSHRSTVLHALGAAQKSAMNLGCDDSIIAIAPMYHACAWGMPFLAAMTGAKLIMPGERHDPESIISLINDEAATFACGVPTVWTMVLRHLAEHGGSLAPLNRTTIGGSAVSRAMIDGLAAQDVRVLHLWGMTEMSPLGTVGTDTSEVMALPDADRAEIRAKQGRGQFLVELKIVDDDGHPLPHDGVQSGALWVRGPWIAHSYFRRPDDDLLDVDGWFPTGDVATIDAHGYMKITDRVKDIIKSGGEWISTVDLENAAVAHPAIELAAVIGCFHPKWEERPLMIVQAAPGATLDHGELKSFLDGRVARWWIPDALEIIAAMPLTATGKIDKRALRSRFADYQFPA